MSRGDNLRPDEARGDRLRLDYEQTTQHIRMLTGLRATPLTILPALTGGAIALLDKAGSKDTVLAVGAFGFFWTLVILVYEMRVAKLYATVTRRAKRLEESLDLLPLHEDKEVGGLFTDEPDRLELFKESKLFTKLTRYEALVMWPDRVFGWVYSLALDGWIYLIVHSLLEALLTEQRFGVVSTPASILFAAIAAILIHRSIRGIEKPH